MAFKFRDIEGDISNFICPFDLTKTPLMRVRLQKTGERQYKLYYDLHHLTAQMKLANYCLNMQESFKYQSIAGVSPLVTINIVFRTLWAILLAKYSGKDDVVFGNVVSGRPPGIIGIERMVGLFTNMLPVRVKFQTGMKFIELLHQVQYDAIESEPHHYHPLYVIQAECFQ